MKKLLNTSIVIAGLVFASAAQAEDIIGKWYDALKTSDRAAFAMILSDNAEVEIKSLGIVQTKPEFIEALDNWEDAAADLELDILDKSKNSDGESVVVCYRFPSNSFTNRESFKISGGQVSYQLQEKLKDGC